MRELTVSLSGPVEEQGPLLQRLERAGVDVSEQPDTHPSWGLPTVKGERWITCLVDNLEVVEKAVARAPRWQVRQHWATPACRACGGQPSVATCLHCKGTGRTNRPAPVVDPLAALEARIAQLEGAAR